MDGTRGTKRRLRLAGILAAAALAAATVTASALAVVGGSPDNGQHPYVAALVWLPTGNPADGFELCSGSLVSPTVVVTAAHCFPDGAPVHVSFDDNARASNPATWPTGTMHSDPAWTPQAKPGLSHFDSNDLAVVVLDQPSAQTRFAQLPAQGYDDALPNNQQIEIVGYGLQQGSGQGAFGVRMVAPAKIVPGGGAVGDEYLKVSSSPGHGGATCSGDSGGPDLQSGTDLMLAISSYGPNATCKAVSYSQRLDTAHALSFVGGFLNG